MKSAITSQFDRDAALHKILAGQAARWVQSGEERRFPALPSLTLYRHNVPGQLLHCVVQPSIALVLQGAKRMLLGEEIFAYDVNRYLITSLDLPATMQVLQASPDKPYLGLALQLDWRLIGELMAQGIPPGGPATGRCVRLGEMNSPMLDAFRRLIGLLDEPDHIPAMAPLILREIHYRLLTGDQGTHLRQVASVSSQSHRISLAVAWLKSHYAEPLSIDELAARVKMSTSTLHHHFRLLTAMSPLQFQKRLRLNEARRFMLADKLDASAAAFQVGYESPTQFSREYSRLFGTPPRRDIEQLRREIDINA